MESIKQAILPWLKRRHEFARFVFFGGVNAVLGYGIYVICLALMSYRTAYTISFASGVLFSYCFNAQFVFREKMRLSRGLQYLVVYVLQYAIGLGLLFMLVEVAHVSKLFAPLLILVTVPMTYVLVRYVIKGGAASSRSR